MLASNANQSLISKDRVWILLAELPFSEFLPDQERKEDPAAELLFRSLRELGMSWEYMEHIARTLTGFAREAPLRTKQGTLEFPRRIRILCQKKGVDEENSAKPSKASHTAESKELKQIFPDSRVGGWGHFIVARVEAPPSHSCAIPHSCIDLYLYREGE